MAQAGLLKQDNDARADAAPLISSQRVEGTKVFRSNGDKIGQIEHIMIDKESGKVAYAVMSYGGFLGMGYDHYPLPWPMLHYNETFGGYEVDIAEEQLDAAPKFMPHESWNWSDRAREQMVHDFWRVPPYWSV